MGEHIRFDYSPNKVTCGLCAQQATTFVTWLDYPGSDWQELYACFDCAESFIHQRFEAIEGLASRTIALNVRLVGSWYKRIEHIEKHERQMEISAKARSRKGSNT